TGVSTYVGHFTGFYTRGTPIKPSPFPKTWFASRLHMSLDYPGRNLTKPEWGEIQDPSELAEAQEKYWSWASSLARKLDERASVSSLDDHPTAEIERSTAVVNGLEGCIFVGHTNTDMDSVASAIGAAYLFNGTAARAEESLNGEITFALEYAGYQSWLREKGRHMPGAILGGDEEGLPPFFPRIPGATDPFSDRGICLVDCNAPEQMVAEVGAVAFPPPSTAEEETIPRAMAMRRRIRGQD
ncbi:manganese-dependent inorganic pyrophosphatase, partial [Nannochloropsis gaditana CCMP526]|uniref:manganese-dependent inorganic pyrophosphatase n=1 Tax=Nannochloropsis gaditana (strain CCMP526) TaxID=1093141 RepID=UPI00029F7392